MCTSEDLTKLKHVVNKTVFIKSCSRKKVNIMWRFHKLTNCTVFAILLEHVPLSWGTPFNLHHFWKIPHSTVSRYESAQKKHKTQPCAFFVKVLPLSMKIDDWKKKLQKYHFNYPLNGWNQPQLVQSSPCDWNCWWSAHTHSSTKENRYSGCQHYRKLFRKKDVGIQKNCATTEVQQPYKLYEQQKCNPQSFSLS